MALTATQLQTLKTDIEANADLNSQPNNGDGNFEIARLYNLTASPDYYVWRNSLNKRQVYGETGLDTDGVTVTQWDWPLYAGLNAGEQGGWTEMWDDEGTSDPSLLQVRLGWADIFSGPQSGPVAQRAHLDAMARRLASRGEKVFVSAGTGTAADPGTTDLIGTISPTDVGNARNLP